MLISGVNTVGLIVCINRPREARKVFIKVQNSGALLHEVETEVLGFNHADVGGALMENWGLSPAQVEGVRFKHTPDQAPQYGMEASILHLANLVSCSLNMGSVGDVSVPPLNSAAWDRINLAPTVMQTLVWEIEDQFEELLKTLTQD